MTHQWHPTAGAYDTDDLRSQDLLPEFSSQPEAEDWLGLYWSDLLEAGVAEVALWNDGQQIQPPMPLSS